MSATWDWLRQHADIFDHPERYSQKRSAFFAAFSLKPTMALAAAAAMMLFLAIGAGYFHRSDADPLAGLIAMEEDVSGARFRKSSEELATSMNAFRAKDLETAKMKFEAVDPKEPDYKIGCQACSYSLPSSSPTAITPRWSECFPSS